MKGYHANSKLVFAYQDKVNRAASINNSLSTADSSNCVVRVVDVVDKSTGITTHHNYNSEGTALEQMGSDFLVSATISCILKQDSTGGTLKVGGGIETYKSVTTITRPEGNRVIDILLSDAVMDLVDSETFLYKAVIELVFSSGESEDLILNLKSWARTTILLDPFAITGEDAIQCEVESGSTELSSQYPQISGARVAYSISKAYRNLKEREQQTLTPTAAGQFPNPRKLYGIGFTGYTPFSQPFGFVSNRGLVDGPFATDSVPLSWLGSVDAAVGSAAYATTTTTHLTWFTGRADMTATILHKESSQSPGSDHTISHASLLQSGINIFPFFATGVNAGRIVDPAVPVGSVLHAETTFKGQGDIGKLHWGRSYGWFSSLVRGNIVDSSGITAVAESSQNYGVPPIYREGYIAPNTGSNIDRPTDFWGAFSEVPSVNNGTAFEGYTYAGSEIFSGNLVQAASLRYSKLFWGQGDLIPGTNVSSSLIANMVSTDSVGSSYLPQISYTYARNNPVYFPNPSVALSNPVSMLRNEGSVGDILTNPGANFFYPGCAGTYQTPFVPVFKGIARVVSTTRVGFTGQNVSGIATAALGELALQGFNLGHLDATGIAIAQEGWTDDTDVPPANFYSKIDLDHSVFFMGHTYPRHAEGSLSDQVSAHLPSFTNSGYNELWVRGYDMLKGEGAALGQIDLVAQDVVFLNSGYTPTSYNSTGASDPFGAAVSRNHPLSGCAFDAEQYTITNPNIHFSDTDYAGKAKPFTVSSKAFHEDLGESLQLPIPPYPYSPSLISENVRQTFIGYAGPTDSTSGAGYFNSNVSPDGTAFSTGTAITLPTSIETNPFVTSGTGNCFGIKSATVTIDDENGVGMFAGAEEGTNRLIYKLTYVNNCVGSEFQTALNEKTVTTTDYPVLVDRINKVLEIFPHIEYRPLAAFDNPLDGVSSIPGTIVVGSGLSSNPVTIEIDDIYIEQSGPEYTLTMIITNSDGDINSQVFRDSTQPADPTTDVEIPTPWQLRYSSIVGDDEFKKHKASYITVASASNWDTFTQGGTANQATGAAPERFAYHAPFYTPGLPDYQDPSDPGGGGDGTDIPGCTDPTAINYNPDATVDNGSCAECNSILSDTFNWDVPTLGINDGQNGMRVGVYNPANQPGGYLFGLAGGSTPIQNYLNVGGAGNSIAVYNSPGAQWGGAVVANNDFVDNTANVYLSIRGINQGNSAFTQVLQWMGEQGETASAWTLKIRAMNDVFESLNFNTSYNESNPFPDLNLLSGLPAAYTATATGGSITAPTWDNIITPITPAIWAETGRAFLLEMHLNPTVIPTECTDLLGNNNVVLGIMWITLCSCANTDNEYFSFAMNGISPYPWQSLGNPFPILPYQPTSNCPDTVDPNSLLGDGAYPNSICFAADEATGNCDQYWLYCISDYNAECTNDPNNTTQIGGSTYFDYDSGYITTQVEGVYSPSSNQFVFSDEITYTITVTGPDGYFEVQTQADASPTPGVFVNTFAGTTAPGTYSVEFVFHTPYPDYFSGDAPCTFVEEVVIPSPIDAGCGEVIEGCTDENFENFDPTATVPCDGCCENPDPCLETLDNSSFTYTIATTNSSSTCFTDTIIINGEPYDATVPLPDNNGTLTTSITYTPPETGIAINNFAVLLVATSSPNPAIQNILDSIDALFINYPTDEINGVTLDGIGYWSPLNSVPGVASNFTVSFVGLPPGNYYVIIVANPSQESLINCGGAAFAEIQDFFNTVNVGMDTPDDCPEPCLGPNCDDYVLGCTDPDDENYNPDATFDDGSCSEDDPICETQPNDPDCGTCVDDPAGIAPRFATGVPEEPPCDSFTGSDGYCTDPNACNYSPDAPLDLSNNLICDYCSCNGEDPDCNEDTDCDPDTDPNCGGPNPECPDPSNPDCDPTIYDPCPADECGPPVDPCIILGNCSEDDGGGDDDGDDFFDEVNPIEVTCIPDVETADGNPLTFSEVQLQAFACMSQEGQKLLFRMKSGAYYDDTDILKLSLVAYLFAGGLNNTELSCLFNCNYPSADKQRAYDCGSTWVAQGAKFYNSTDSYNRGDIVVYYYLKGSKITRSFYTAVRTVTPMDVHPRFPNSGWTRCQDVKLRTSDRNQIATGNEEYLQVFWEFLTRFCNECKAVPNPPEAEENNVDPKILKNYLDPKTNNINTSSNSGIVGEDGEEIIF